LLLSTAVFGAATRAISTARALSEGPTSLPVVADFSLVRSAISSPTAWLAACLSAAAIAIGIRRRSHVAPVIGLLAAIAVVYFHMMDVWLEPATGVFDIRPFAAVMWLYMPQSLAMPCFAAHLAIAYRRR
jgi:biotin transporter BioY